jgi:hypothetical protein
MIQRDIKKLRNRDIPGTTAYRMGALDTLKQVEAILKNYEVWT